MPRPQINVRLSEPLQAALAERAARQDCTIPELIRHVLSEYATGDLQIRPRPMRYRHVLGEAIRVGRPKTKGGAK